MNQTTEAFIGLLGLALMIVGIGMVIIWASLPVVIILIGAGLTYLAIASNAKRKKG